MVIFAFYFSTPRKCFRHTLILRLLIWFWTKNLVCWINNDKPNEKLEIQIHLKDIVYLADEVNQSMRFDGDIEDKWILMSDARLLNGLHWSKLYFIHLTQKVACDKIDCNYVVRQFAFDFKFNYSFTINNLKCFFKLGRNV